MGIKKGNNFKIDWINYLNFSKKFLKFIKIRVMMIISGFFNHLYFSIYPADHLLYFFKSGKRIFFVLENQNLSRLQKRQPLLKNLRNRSDILRLPAYRYTAKY